MKISLLTLIGYIVLIGFTALQDVSKSPSHSTLADIRYLAAAFPFTAVLAAGILDWIHRKNKIIAGAFLITATCTNLAYSLPKSNNTIAVPMHRSIPRLSTIGAKFIIITPPQPPKPPIF